MIQKWCEITSCNGVIDLYEARNDKKKFLFWSVIMILSLAASMWFVYRTVVGYINTPTVTNVGTKTDSLLKIPDVLVEYNGGLNVSAMKEANFSEELIHAFSASFVFATENKNDLTAINDELQKYMKRHNLGYGEVAKKFGYTCEEMVSSVYQSSQQNDSMQRCERAELIISDKGNGYEFRNNTQQWYPGLWDGLVLRLGAPKNSYALRYPIQGLRLSMNHEFAITLEHKLGPVFSKRDYLIPLDTKVTMTLNTKLYKRVNGSRTCTTDENLTTSNACFFTCWLSAMTLCTVDGRKQCYPMNALAGRVPLNDSNICNPLYFDHKCINIRDGQECNKNCLPLCEEWFYETTLSYSSLAYLNLNESMSIVYIGYNTMQYTIIEEVTAFTIDMAISNVGGQFGLWLGLSILTIIQGIYYCVLAACSRTQTTDVEKLGGTV